MKQIFRKATAKEILAVLVVVSVVVAVIGPYYLNKTKTYAMQEQRAVVMETYAAAQNYIAEHGVEGLGEVWVYNNGQFEKRYNLQQTDIWDALGDNVDVYHYDNEKGYFVGDCVVRCRIDEKGNITEHRVFTQDGNFTTRIIPGEKPSYKEGNQLKNVW